jgi:5,10-methylene-tetrahydrofolate dehydrogenase/methenyl tetrahydrofolate cyclohydrolase
LRLFIKVERTVKDLNWTVINTVDIVGDESMLTLESRYFYDSHTTMDVLKNRHSNLHANGAQDDFVSFSLSNQLFVLAQDQN